VSSTSFDNLCFHIGLHKTGTTFLQRLVFPRLEEVTYLTWRNLEYFLRLRNDRRYLVSCEGFSGKTFARLGERCAGLDRLGAMFPRAKVIVGFRRHGSLLASLYSQYLRYGGKGQFLDFIALSDSQQDALLSRADISFRGLLETIESSFGRPAFAFDMHHAFREPSLFLQDLCSFVGCRPGRAGEAFGAPPRNTGLLRRQAEWLRWCNQKFDVRFSDDGRQRPYAKLARYRIDPPTVCLTWLSFIPSGPLLSEREREKIDAIYSEDWDFVHSYIGRRPWEGEIES
jgi:hypothetical protein